MYKDKEKQKAAWRRYYYRHKAASVFKGNRVVYRKAVRSRNLAIANAFKAGPCADCGNSYPPYVMDFHHVRGKKMKNVSQLISQTSSEILLAEIYKCDVLCANCHRIRTHK
jgi:hypothetical protein